MSKRSRKAKRKKLGLRQKAEAEARPPVMRGIHSSDEYRVAKIKIVASWPFSIRSW